MKSADIFQQCKDEIAQKHYNTNWDNVRIIQVSLMERLMTEASLLAMERIAEMSLTKGVEIGKCYTYPDGYYHHQGEVDEKSTYMKNNMKTGIELIAQERKEQIEKHGRTVESDLTENNDNQLRVAAMRLIGDRNDYHPPFGWSYEIWNKMLSKPVKERLIIAGALIAAEIDRIQIELEKALKALEHHRAKLEQF